MLVLKQHNLNNVLSLAVKHSGLNSRAIACSTAVQLFTIKRTSFAWLDLILEIGSTARSLNYLIMRDAPFVYSGII